MSIDKINRITSPIHLQEYNKPSLTPIACKPPTEAHKTLGVWKSMDGNVWEQVQVLAQRSKNLANIVATSGLYPYQADVALRMIYTPAMTYSLPSVSIPEAALNKIQNKTIESFLPAMGFNKSFPSAVVLGPKEYGGLGVPHLYPEMNLMKIEYLLMHLRSNSDLGKLFQINLNWIQLHLGLSTPLFECKHPIKHMCNCWFTHIHEFLLKINARLVIPNTYQPKMERELDCCIMEVIEGCSVPLSKNQLRHMHNWRLFFKVQKLSDMTNPAGDQILPLYLTFPSGNHQSDRVSKLDWPHQEHPTCRTSFQLWVKCLRVCFLQNRSSRLTKPLGKWILSPTETESVWSHYIDTSHSVLIHRTNATIIRYFTVSRNTSCTTAFDPQDFEIIESIPDNYFPVQVTITDHNIIAAHNKQNKIVPPSSAQHYSLSDDITTRIQHSPSWKKHTLQHFHIFDSDEFLHDIQQVDKKFLIVSDGGLCDGNGSFGVAMGTYQSELAMIEGPAPVNDLLNTSLRSEAYGLLAGLVAFLNLYTQTYDVKFPVQRHIHLFSDNLGLVRWTEELLNHSTYPRMYL